MNKRQALKIGARGCYIYRRDGDQWATVSPWKTSDPQGPKTEGQKHGHTNAIRQNAANVAEVALFQYLDARPFDRECIREGYAAIWHARERGTQCTARALLDVGIEEAKRWQQLALRAELLEKLEMD